MPSQWDQVAVVMLGMFVGGLIWDAAKRAEQLRELREWRRRADRKLDRIMVAVGAVAVHADEQDT
jgi:hypothetical protein